MSSVLKNVLKGFLVIIAALVASFILFCAWFVYESDFKRTVILSEKYSSGAPYELVVSEIGSTFIFSPSDVKIKLKKNGKTIYKKEIEVSNDGKALSHELNFKTEWSKDKLIITAMGEEQKDENIEIPLD